MLGNGDLIRSIEATGHAICLWASDKYIAYYGESYFKLDAMDITKDDLKDIDMIITNPPWSRNILHPMIEHFANLKPTWLLFDAGWAYTKQSSELIKKYCTDIVAVGRLKWIPNTAMSGKDDCAWYKFNGAKVQNPNLDVRFHGR